MPFHDATALHFACSSGQLPMAKALVRHGASRVVKDNFGHTPLMWAAQSGHLACVILMVGRPEKPHMSVEEVNLADVNGATALHCAARSGDANICGVLLQAGAQLDAQTSCGMTPLMEALDLQPRKAALHALLAGAEPSNLPGTLCDHCGKTAEAAGVKSFSSCGACFSMRYCDAACQNAGWPSHKAACKKRRAQRDKQNKQTKLNVYEPLC